MINWKKEIMVNEAITLKKTTKNDFMPLLKMYRNDDIQEYMWDTTPYSDQDILRLFEISINERDWISYSIWITPNNFGDSKSNQKIQKLIGKIDIQFSEFEEKSKIGIIIGLPEFWNKGIGTLSLKAVIDYLFCLKFYKIKADVFQSNSRSIHIFSKLGFVEEGFRLNDIKKRYKRESLIEYALFNKYLQDTAFSTEKNSLTELINI